MVIKYTRFNKEKEHSLYDIIEKREYNDRLGAIEEVEDDLDYLTRFCTKTIELLYSKGLISKKDVLSLISDYEDFYNCDNVDII